jgi:hypothetical protein
VQRRTFLKNGLGVVAADALRLRVMAVPAAATPGSQPFFSTENQRWQKSYDKAIETLASNVQVMPRFAGPVLIEGSKYGGIWQECGPHESLVYRHSRSDVARCDQNERLTPHSLVMCLKLPLKSDLLEALIVNPLQ